MALRIHDRAKPNLPGAVVLKTPEQIKTLDEWVDYYGLDATKTKLRVYKLVDDDLKSGQGTLYELGTRVTCDDWSTAAECGEGLHFSPSPSATHRYADGTRYLLCEVARKDVVLLGDKLKAKACRVICEVDIDGEPVAEEAKAA